MDGVYEFVFPAIRGVQAGREHFVTMCPLRLLPRLFALDEVTLFPELRAQRLLNRSRVPEIARYMVEGPDDYVFSSITATVDGEVKFLPSGGRPPASDLGTLRISMSARFILNDGQHRRAAIEMALSQRPELADEAISLVLFIDQGLRRCQQMFADLNRYAIRPSRSLGVLYDHRDDRADLARMVVFKIPLFKELTDLEKSTLAARSRCLFTLSALYTATGALLHGCETRDPDARATIALSFWEEVSGQIPQWARVYSGTLSAGEVRQDFIHSHGVVLHALGRVGCALFQHHPADWQSVLPRLQSLDWRRSNENLWEGRAMVGGRVSKSEQHVTLTTNAIKTALGLPLLPEESRIEKEFKGMKNVAA